jgi:hypothetical protein
MFYAALPTFTRFEQFSDPAQYHALPDDWLVYVADVAGSTAAIAEGRYRDVNLIGAATITTLITALPKLPFPFVFGGDGATCCLPPECGAAADATLGGLVQLAAKRFALELRVARIPVAELRRQGAELQVAKFALRHGNTLAFFRGAGVELADRLAKAPDQRWRIPAVPDPLDELVGLSCRWAPIPSQRGRIVSLLVKSRRPERDTAYAEVLDGLRSVLGASLDEAIPVAMDEASYRSFPDAMADEARYHGRWVSRRFWARIVAVFNAVLIFRPRRNLAARFYDRRRYVDSIRDHSDHRKFDDTLRMVLDCTVAQADALEALLTRAQRDGTLYFGMFRSDDALMTCFVKTTQDGEHLHFIDGGDGGFAMAARQFKAQMVADAPAR